MTSRSTHLRPDDWRLGIWRQFLRIHTETTRRLERDLVTEADMPLAWYDVLLQLAEAPEHRLRMADLAERVLLSRSGLTRLVDRLSAEGLVERQPSLSDKRGLYTVLTEAGLTRLRAAAPTHLAGIERYWVSRFSDDELHTLGRLLGRLTRLGDDPVPAVLDVLDAVDRGQPTGTAAPAQSAGGAPA